MLLSSILCLATFFFVRTLFSPSEIGKKSKQLKYANQNNIPFIVFVGEEFKEEMTFELKNMLTGDQNILKLSQFLSDLYE